MLRAASTTMAPAAANARAAAAPMPRLAPVTIATLFSSRRLWTRAGSADICVAVIVRLPFHPLTVIGLLVTGSSAGGHRGGSARRSRRTARWAEGRRRRGGMVLRRCTSCLLRRVLSGVAGAGERLDPDHVWVPWVGRKDLTPGALAPGPGPLDTD